MVYYNEKGSKTNSTGFLIGVATLISSHQEASGYWASYGQENAYFSSIKSLIKFVEHFANMGEYPSVFCKTPSLTLNPIKFDSFTGRIKDQRYLWNDLSRGFPRDDSLTDCSRLFNFHMNTNYFHELAKKVTLFLCSMWNSKIQRCFSNCWRRRGDPT